MAGNGYFALAVFAEQGEVLPLPKPKLPILAAAWYHARGEALRGPKLPVLARLRTLGS